MTPMTGLPAREPVSDTLRQAARLRLRLQLEPLPSSDTIMHTAYTAIAESPGGRHPIKRPRSRRIALDTAFALCAEHAGQRLLQAAVAHAERVITQRCPFSYFPFFSVQPAIRLHALICRGRIPPRPLKDPANRAPDEHNHRASDGGPPEPGHRESHPPADAPPFSLQTGVP